MAPRTTSKSPIVSRKHYVHRSNTQLSSGLIQNNIVAEGVVSPATTLASDVIEGSIVKAVYVEMWLGGAGLEGNSTQFSLTVEKISSAGPVMTFAQSLALGAYPNKKNIFYTTQGVLAGENSNTVPVVRNWILIPKGKQRMGLSDRIMVNVAASGQNIDVCGIFTYKEYQ